MRTFQYLITLPKPQWAAQTIPTCKFVTAEGCAMPDAYFNGRPVYFGDVYLSGGVDSYFEDACYADTMEDLDDDELSDLTDEHADYLCEKNCEEFGWFQK